VHVTPPLQDYDFQCSKRPQVLMLPAWQVAGLLERGGRDASLGRHASGLDALLPCLLSKLSSEDGVMPEMYLFLLHPDAAPPPPPPPASRAGAASTPVTCLASVSLDEAVASSTARGPNAVALSGFLRYALYLPTSFELLLQSQGQPEHVLQKHGMESVLDPWGKLGLHPPHTLMRAVSVDDEVSFGIKL
jgi:hypothetical protein